MASHSSRSSSWSTLTDLLNALFDIGGIDDELSEGDPFVLTVDIPGIGRAHRRRRWHRVS